jgi:NitT/TauT family transport system permease protein
MVFPVLYGNIREGITSVSRELLEMARVFRLSFFLKIKRIYAPAIAPYFFAAVTASVGLALKAGIAAEVIAYIPLSIGKKLSDAKSYMEPADLLAWTAAILIIGLLLEYVLRITLKRIQRRRTDGKAD